MSTTRHLLNRRRRLTAQHGAEDDAPPTAGTSAPKTATRTATAVRERGPASRTLTKHTPHTPAEAPTAERSPRPAAPRRLLALCAVVTVACGTFAAWGAGEAGALRDGAAARNAALADAGRTSEVKGEVTSAVNALFSYDHTRPARNARAAERLLTGRAVKQHRALLARVRAQGGRQRLVLTTTVTDSAVAALEGNRARVLLFADQHSARTDSAAGKAKTSPKAGRSVKGEEGRGSEGKNGAADDTTYAGAMLSVDAVRKAGTWKIANIDTLN